MRRSQAVWARWAGAMAAAAAAVGVGWTASAAAPAELVGARAPQATAPERARMRHELRDDKVTSALSRPLSDGAEAKKGYAGAFWAVGLIRDRRPLVREAVRQSLALPEAGASGFGRQALETAYTLFPTELRAEVEAIAAATTSPKHFAMAAEYVVRAAGREGGAGAAEEERDTLGKAMVGRFGDGDGASTGTASPILRALARRLAGDAAAQLATRPPLRALLGAPSPGGWPVLFSLHRHDRRFPGLSVIRDPQGRFLRDEPGGLRVWAIPHLAMSNSNLPGYLSNGNTPQGIMAVVGEGVSDNQFIGPTPFLETVLPVEGKVTDFLGDDAPAGTAWSEELYAGLLPEGPWRQWLPLREGWLAGQAGRGEIILHGTTIDPEFFRGEPCYPMTPSMGCLCSRELWSRTDGRAEVSDQAALVAAWRRASATTGGRGLVVLVELDDLARPVDLNDVLPELLAAEAHREAGEGP